MIIFEILGEPIEWEDPENDKGQYLNAESFWKNYEPQEERISAIMNMANSKISPGSLFEKSIILSIVFEIGYPDFIPDHQIEGYGPSMIILYYDGAPSIFNLTKLVEEALDGIIWEKRGHVFEITASKIYSRTPCTRISIGIRKETVYK